MPDVSRAPASGATALSHLGVIRARGPQAADFLHGQLTQDVAHLATGGAAFAAYLSSRGRVLASCVVLRSADDELLLVCHRSVLAATLKRLSMFVLRAQVVLHDASADRRLVGLLGDAAEALVPADAAPWSCRATGRAHAIALHPADGQPRALWLAPADEPPPDAAPVDIAAWLRAEVRSGVVTLSQPVADAFVPQMLNYESVGGVHLHKGCYPGQEVVARSQFRGSVKRRTFLAHCDAPLAVGDEIFDAGDSVGTVAQAAAAPGGGSDALIVLPLGAAGQPLRHGTPGGAPVALLPLPYALLQES